MAGDSGNTPATSAPASGESGLNFCRPPTRVVALLFFAPIAYELWWYWQLFQFTRREQFPRTRAFWWILVPIYGWVVIYRQFDDLAKANDEIRPAFSSSAAIWLVILSNIVGNGSARLDSKASLIAFLVSDALIAW